LISIECDDSKVSKGSRKESGIDWFVRAAIEGLLPAIEPPGGIRLKVHVPLIGRGTKSSRSRISFFIVRKIARDEQVIIDALTEEGHRYVAYTESPPLVARTAPTPVGALTAAEQELRKRLLSVSQKRRGFET
jgi:hypothetical protein